SQHLSDDFQVIALKCGFSADIHKRPTYYDVQIYGYKDRDTTITTANKNRKDDSFKKYNDMVYDVTVPNHVLYARRNGKAVWSGNCWQKAMTLYYQDRYIMKYYDKQRSPRALFAVATSSLNSFTKS